MRLSPIFAALLLATFTILHGPPAHAQGQPPASPVPDPYRQKFVRYVDNRTLKDTMLNAVGLTGNDVGRSFALIAGISQYPNMPEVYKTLPPAAADIEELKNYLIHQEMFDEVVVLKDGDMSPDNLHYFMEVYFPDRLQRFPKSRFLFAYSGHRAADAGNASGMVNLGAMYANGLGEATNDAEAISWFHRAADAGNLKGMLNLGAMYEDGSVGITPNVNEAITWYRKAAALGNVDTKQALERLHQ